MGIVYTTKAKEDLINIDWRIRQKIVNTLGKIQDTQSKHSLLKMHNSDYYKLKISNHLVIGTLEEHDFNIITVVEEKRIKYPD